MPAGLDAKVKVDLVVVGSVAVSEKGLLAPQHLPPHYISV